MNLWNVKILEPPASSSCKLQNHDIDLHEVNGLMNDALNLFASQIYLDAESKMLHRIVKLHKLKYRTTIGFKHIQKLNRCVRNYDEFDYKSLIAWYANFLPSKYESDTYFPSRNMLDYFLVRTQGFGKLCVRLMECAKQVYIHWMDRVNLGHNLGIALICVAMQARLFIIFRYLLQCTCHLYDSLMALRVKVPNIKYTWLPSDYNLPPTLLKWLDADWVFKENVRELKGRNRNLVVKNTFDVDDVEFCQEYHIVEDDDDLQIVNEYLNVLGSDEEGDGTPRRVKVEEIDEDLAVITEQVRNTIGMKKVPKRKQIINLDDEIGEPVEQVAKIAELRTRLDKIKTLKNLEKFISDASHQYFRSLGMPRYQQLLNMVQMRTQMHFDSKKQQLPILREVKEMVLQFVQNG